jgi:superfamily II DNA or RNA helicase
MSSKIKVKKSKIIKKSKNKPISPSNWVLPNKKRFPSWINETFIKYRLTDDIQKTKGKEFEPFPYQKFLRDYMQLNSPYRGILLYHGLGSGKTCSAIAIAEQMRSEKKILVLLPASLRHNFIGTVGKEGLKFCGAKEYQNRNSGNKDIKEYYTFISYNSSNVIKQLDAYGSLDNHVIIVDESHKLISMMANSMQGMSKQGGAIYDKLLDAKNSKIIFLSGTPINTEAFEAALMFNILRGIIEMQVFFIQSVDEKRYGPTWALKKFEDLMIDIDEVDYVEINKQNKLMTIHLRSIMSYDTKFNEVIDKIVDSSSKAGVMISFDKTHSFPLFPNDLEEFQRYFLDTSDPLNEKIKNKDVFKRRILGLTSYYRGAKKIYYPLVNEVKFVNVDMSDYQYQQYAEARLVEQDSEKRSRVSMAAAEGKSSKSAKKGGLFRIFSREFSNFVFPPDIDRPYLKHSSIKKPGSNKKKDKSNGITNILKNADVIANENMENVLNKKKLNERYQKRLQSSLSALDSKASEYLTPGKNGLDKYSPKMKAILENLKSCKGKILVYSNFRALEGIEIFSKVLDHNGFKQYKKGITVKKGEMQYALFTGTEDDKERIDVLAEYNSYDNRYGDKLKVLMITSAGAEGLDLKCVRQVHIMEPYWTEIRAQQVIGRAVRVNSHVDLPPNERVVDIFRYHSVFTKQQRDERKYEPLSTDEYVYKNAMIKQRVVDDLLFMLKETAVDCVLNSFDNETKEQKIDCFNFGKDKDGLAYLPSLSKDIIYSQTGISTKKVKRNIIPAGLTKDGYIVYADSKTRKLYSATNKGKLKPLKDTPKITKKVGVDLNSGEVFDFKAVKFGKNLILLGNIDPDTGSFIKN